MTMTRRSFVLFSLCASAQELLGQTQGIATREVKAQPKPAPSGRPFDAHFTDIAKEAGLHAPVIYGGVESKKYIMEANGCGCAFIDYDNDGWMDIFLLSGTRLEGDPPEATNRLYKNNRDGTFTDVTEKSGLKSAGWANGVCVADYNNDGFDDIFCTYFGQNRLYRNNGDGTFTDVTKASRTLRARPCRWGAGCAFLDYNRDGHLDLFVSNYIQILVRARTVPGENSTCNWKGVPVNAGLGGFPPAGIPCIATTATGHSLTSPSRLALPRNRELRNDRRHRRLRRGRLARHLRRVRFHAQPAVHEQS